MARQITPIVAFLAASMLLNGFAPAQSERRQNSSRFDITLNDRWVEKLKSLGTLQSALREDAPGRIAAIQIEFADTETQPFKVIDAPISVAGNACQIAINDELLEQARFQPVRITVPDSSQFAQVFLNYASGDASTAAADSDTRNGSGLRAQNASSVMPSSEPFHYVKLSGNKVMMGQMELTEKLKFTTKFGEVDISLGQIAGIRLHIDGEDSAIVVLTNGDSVTGVPSLDSVVLNTDWGRAEFDPVYIEAITTSRNATFRQTNDTEFGHRWQLNNR